MVTPNVDSDWTSHLFASGEPPGSEGSVVWLPPSHSGEPTFLRPMASGLKGQGGLSKTEGLPES